MASDGAPRIIAEDSSSDDEEMTEAGCVANLGVVVPAAAPEPAAPPAPPEPACAPDGSDNSKCGMRGSYFRRRGLHLEEEVQYQGAELLPFREVDLNKFEVLLCTCPTGVKPYGGLKVLESDPAPIDTAIRRLAEEVGTLLTNESYHALRAAALKRGALWLREMRHVLFILDVTALGLSLIRDVTSLPATLRRPRRQGGVEATGAEWVSLADMLAAEPPAEGAASRWHPFVHALNQDPAFQHVVRSSLRRPKDKCFGPLDGPAAVPKPPPGSKPAPRKRPAPPPTAPQPPADAHLIAPEAGEEEEGATNLRITGLPRDWGDAELHDLCQPFGAVKRFTVWMDPQTRISRQYGFVEFEEVSGAVKAKAGLEGKKLPGMSMPVTCAFNYPKGDPRRPLAIGRGRVTMPVPPTAPAEQAAPPQTAPGGASPPAGVAAEEAGAVGDGAGRGVVVEPDAKRPRGEE
eukprot:TRINITY_DN18437_c0_g1_i6.p1 TRINITY_DN18437_c0_g1~~TRINITY_DN18437_c0_g1_i6.p1  ORF type:complete len:461 (+),score=135.96 TRINITY_DN18437_c0_g1_i6:73-1455(+)